ncbi:MAG: exodeoxyribonuclease V subunit alpha [Planctomycetota bacterium]
MSRAARVDERRDPGAQQLAARLAALLQRLCAAAGGTGDGRALAAAAAAVLEALQDGHTCAVLTAVLAAAGEPAPWSDVPALRAALLATGAVADAAVDPDAAPARPLPLVLDGDRLYLLRHHAAERRVAARLRQRLGPVADVPAATLQVLRDLARAAGDDAAIDWQNVAVAAAVRSRLCVVTGGPGTGKTTTIRKIVRALLAGRPDLQVALVAPTGKAAARMGEALQDELQQHGLPRATTLHRLLGYLPLEDTFRFGDHAPLPHDLVIVDEASMVDLELMDALLAALSSDTRLVLLGDRDQLSSVGAGQVLADLCAATAGAPRTGKGLAAFCNEHLGCEVPARLDDDTPFADAVVALQRTWRFDAASGIGAFARAMAARAPDDALRALRSGAVDVRCRAPEDLDALLREHTATLLAQVEAETVEDALAALSRLRILCATRHGPFGKDAITARVEALLREHGRRPPGAFYQGRPLLVTANDHASQLWNGDLGVAFADAQDRLMAWFRAADGTPRPYLPLRLPPHETAWAMTVHKSQGSEFDEVLVVLPDRPGPLLHAPLVYTAITRARRRATVVARPELLEAALRAEPLRATGLPDLLHRRQA